MPAADHERASAVTVRRLDRTETPAAFPVMLELRSHLASVEDFCDRVARQSDKGYELLGAFRGEEMVGVLGMRPVETLTRGRHLHVDDLCVRSDLRGSGVGRALLSFAEADARSRGLVSVFLDSRLEVVGFYDKLGYEPHTAKLMRRKL